MHTSNKVTIGMDVSDRWSQVAVMDDQGVVVISDRVATKEPAVRRHFGRFTGARIAIEVGPHSPWLSRVFADTGFDVIAGNPRKIGLFHSCCRSRRMRPKRSRPLLLAPRHDQHRPHGLVGWHGAHPAWCRIRRRPRGAMRCCPRAGRSMGEKAGRHSSTKPVP